MTLTIEKPDMKYIPAFIEALKEGPFNHMALGGFGNTTAEEVEKDPVGYIALLTSPEPRKVTTPNGREFTLKDHEIFWMIEDGKFVGGFSMRYDRDCELIDKYAGNFGMSVISSMRGRGYGAKAWGFRLQRAAEKGLDFVRVSCAPDNTASKALILKFGGELQGTSDPLGWGPAEIYRIRTQPVAPGPTPKRQLERTAR